MKRIVPQEPEPSFRLSLPTEVRFGPGSLGTLPALLRGSAAIPFPYGRTALLVTGRRFARKTGLTKRVVHLIGEAGVRTEVFEGMAPDPRADTVEEAARFAADKQVDFVVGLGGGSSIDGAKAVAALLTNPGGVQGLIGPGGVQSDPLPIVAIPTTAGTGSEVSPVSVLVVGDGPSGPERKTAIYSERIRPALAVVDPELTVSMPQRLTAATAVDALTHAIESAVARNADPVSQSLALQSVDLIFEYLPKALKNPDDPHARYWMMLASTMAGIAFSQTGLGAVHALSYSVGMEGGISHGEACAILLPHVMRFNLPAREAEFMAIGRAASSPAAKPADAVESVEGLLSKLGFPMHLSDLGIEFDSMDRFARSAYENRRLLESNPRAVRVEDLRMILEEAY